MNAIVMGAGLAGLTCARRLLDKGVDVHIFEAGDDVGGRVRSDRHSGFILDRGFQVLFDAYPAVQRNVDIKALDLHRFDPGAVICKGGRQHVVTDLTRDRSIADVAASALNVSISPGDKLRILKLAMTSRSGVSVLRPELDSQSTRDYLLSIGLSEGIVDDFFTPFFGGIFLDRSLETSAAIFDYYFQMLSRGHATLPGDGIGALSKALAEPLVKAGRVSCNLPVRTVLRNKGAALGVLLETGEEVRSEIVVVATDAPAAAALADITVPEGALGTVTLYYAGIKPLTCGRKVYLNANKNAFVNNVQDLSSVAPAYAPRGRHLISASLLGCPALDDKACFEWGSADIIRMLSGDREASRAFAGCVPLRLYRIAYSQFPQPHGSLACRTQAKSMGTRNLYTAGEWDSYSSIDGAISSGEKCAQAILADA